MMEWLDEIVVGTGIEPGNTLVDGSLGGDDQHGQPRIVVPEATKQGQAVAVGQAEIEQYEIVLLPRDCRFGVRNG
ncbi:hypothetical protein D9M72_476970 [compost metagenome]